MADPMKTKSDPAGQMWDELDCVENGLLTFRGTNRVSRPLPIRADRHSNTVWLSTNRHCEVVTAIGKGAEADLCIVGKRHDYHARLSGLLTINTCRNTSERFQNPLHTGRPSNGAALHDIMLLRLKLTRGDMWTSVSCPIALRKAFGTKHAMPIANPASIHAHVRFHHFEKQSAERHASHDANV